MPKIGISIGVGCYPSAGGIGGGDTTAPTLTSATINAAGTSLSLLFSEAVTFGAGGNGGWTITATLAGKTVSYASGTGTTTLVYTISSAVLSLETVTVTYVQPGNGVEDLAGNDLASLSNQAVVNNSTQTTGLAALANWWERGVGIVKSGANLTTWTDLVGSKTMTAAGTPVPQIVTTGGVDTVEFNLAGWLVSAGLLVNTRSEGWFIVLGRQAAPSDSYGLIFGNGSVHDALYFQSQQIRRYDVNGNLVTGHYSAQGYMVYYMVADATHVKCGIVGETGYTGDPNDPTTESTIFDAGEFSPPNFPLDAGARMLAIFRTTTAPQPGSSEFNAFADFCTGRYHTTARTNTTMIAVIGDSITNDTGHGCQTDPLHQSWVPQCMGLSASPPKWYNVAQGGTKLVDNQNGGQALIQLTDNAGLFTNYIVITAYGHNDISSDGATALQLITYLNTQVANLKAAGATKVIVVTIPASTQITGTGETTRLAYNLAITTLGTNADDFIDSASAITPANASDPAVLCDGVHPTPAFAASTQGPYAYGRLVALGYINA